METIAEFPVRRDAPAARPALRFVVRAAADKWEVTFGEGGACFVYASRSAAIRAARGAARRQWQVRGLRAAVAIEEAGRARLLADYGA
jgi:hypothetical protein